MYPKMHPQDIINPKLKVSRLFDYGVEVGVMEDTPLQPSAERRDYKMEWVRDDYLQGKGEGKWGYMRTQDYASLTAGRDSESLTRGQRQHSSFSSGSNSTPNLIELLVQYLCISSGAGCSTYSGLRCWNKNTLQFKRKVLCAFFDIAVVLDIYS